MAVVAQLLAAVGTLTAVVLILLMAAVPLLLDLPLRSAPHSQTRRTSVGRGADRMRTIGNILWFLLAGWWLALYYVLCGLLAFVLIVTIPFGIAAFRLAGYTLWPFGRRVVAARDAGVPSVIGNILWIVLFGWQLFLAHIAAGIFLCLTIIGIPFGIAAFKLSVISLLPLGTRVVDADVPQTWAAPVPQTAAWPSQR